MKNFHPWRRLSDSSGQAMIIAVGLALMMVIALAAVFFINQMEGHHQVAGTQRAQGRSVAEEGIAYITEELAASSTTWTAALAGNFAGTSCNGGFVKTPSGGRFKIYCSTGTTGNPKLQIYQVAVISVAAGAEGASQGNDPLRAIKAYLSQRTLGADIATGIHAAAAAEVIASPVTVTGTMKVHWGPIVSLDDRPFTLPDSIDIDRYPRKFSGGDIVGASPNPATPTYPRSKDDSSGPITDQAEYWAQAALTPPPLIDEDSYLQSAKAENGITAPKSWLKLRSGALPNTINPTACATVNCGYFVPAVGDAAVFDGGGNGYTAPPGSVIFVDGAAEFRRMDVVDATIIVTGFLRIGDAPPVGLPAGLGGQPRLLHVPQTAGSEYPYAPFGPPSTPTWPCHGSEGATLVGGQPDYNCPSAAVFPSGKVQFHGFLYVKGHLFKFADQDWNMAGALLVGDREVPRNTSGALDVVGAPYCSTACTGTVAFNLAYDDIVNHQIRVLPISPSGAIRLVPDHIEDIPVF